MVEPLETCAMNPQRVRMRLDAHATVFSFDDSTTVELTIGPEVLIERALRHDPPRAPELERAIDLVEDALARWPGARPDGAELVIDTPPLSALPGLGQPEAVLDRDGVEALFQRMVSRTVGNSVAGAELPLGAPLAAALLILRECMHHLGFARVVTRRP